jgi:hypothetical protein
MSDRVAREPAPQAAAEELEPKEAASEVAVSAEAEQYVAEHAEAPVAGEVNSQDDVLTEAVSELTLPARQDGSAELAERIGKSNLLPPGLRTRLAEVTAAGGGVAEAVRAVEEALPGVLRLSERDVSRPAHKTGEAFFRGDGAVSDDEAESMARGQLARTGMLRGQRVRVAD